MKASLKTKLRGFDTKFDNLNKLRKHVTDRSFNGVKHLGGHDYQAFKPGNQHSILKTIKTSPVSPCH